MKSLQQKRAEALVRLKEFDMVMAESKAETPEKKALRKAEIQHLEKLCGGVIQKSQNTKSETPIGGEKYSSLNDLIGELSDG